MNILISDIYVYIYNVRALFCIIRFLIIAKGMDRSVMASSYYPSVQMTINPIYDEIPAQNIPESPAPSYTDIAQLSNLCDGEEIVIHDDIVYHNKVMDNPYESPYI